MKLKQTVLMLMISFVYACSNAFAAQELASQEELYTGKEYTAAFINPEDNPSLPNVLLIGDSISNAYTVDVRKRLRGKADVFRIPGNGKNSAYGLENLDKWLGTRKWDVIHFNWGLWDLCYRNPESKMQGHRDKVNGTITATPEQYRANMEKIVARLKQTNATLIWCTTTPVPEFEAGRKLGDDLRYNQIAEKIMKANGVLINDLHAHALLKYSEIQKQKGDVHYTKEGSSYLAEKVAQEIASACSALNANGQASFAKAPADKPNIIIIFTDDQGYQDLGCFGSPDIKTPRIDQMAAEGMRFTDFYAQTVCGPSRGALMTGCYPLRFARHDDPDSIHPEMHLNEITIAEVLKEQGYATAAIGKWDLAGHSQTKYKPQLLPPHQGFDYYFGTPGSNDSSVNLIRNTEKIETKADMSTLTKRYTDEALTFIEDNKDGPFFVYLAHTMPHTKLAVSKDFKGKSAGGFYGDVIEELDFNVGRVLDKVKELGLDDNTYIIFTSDNGPWLIRKEHGGHADPLRSGKTSCWEGGLRVPCIMRAPGRIPAGTECNAVTATIDMMPTIAKLAGGSPPSDRVIDGVDISSLMHGKATSLNRSYFYYQHNCLRAVRSGKWKLMLPHTEPVKTSIATKWKNHIPKADAIRIKKAMLFDLDADISETTDVSDKYPEKVAELMKLAQWAQHDIGNHDTFGANARTFGSQPRTLSSEAKAVPKKKTQ